MTQILDAIVRLKGYPRWPEIDCVVEKRRDERNNQIVLLLYAADTEHNRANKSLYPGKPLVVATNSFPDITFKGNLTTLVDVREYTSVLSALEEAGIVRQIGWHPTEPAWDELPHFIEMASIPYLSYGRDRYISDFELDCLYPIVQVLM